MYNFQEINVIGDGNCLFRCISYYLYDNEDYYYIIRRKMIDYVSKYKSNFMSSINLTEKLDLWISKMNNYGLENFGFIAEFGDSFAIEILTWMLEIPIIISCRNEFNIEYQIENFGNWFDKPPIQLILKNQHYILKL